ncbi:MAG: toprim domain-containing protein [Desulfoprunum sp.]|nr:toprim domain-containing protein [Desulfoprunum sp.]
MVKRNSYKGNALRKTRCFLTKKEQRSVNPFKTRFEASQRSIYWSRNSRSGVGLFPGGKDDKGKEVLNARLFAPPPGEEKNHSIGSPDQKERRSVNLSEKLLEALRQSPYWTAKTRANGNTIQGLTCPVCGDKSAWTYAAGPMAINCNRLSQCGARTKTLELFPEVRRNIERDFPATKTDPHRPAREYLLSRAISESTLQGLDYRYEKTARGGAVMFPCGKDGKGKEVLNGRLFNPPPGEGKSQNVGSTTGRFWKHPNIIYDPNKPVWIYEGIFDSLSRIEMGGQAIAVLSAGQDPAKVDLSEFPHKILAFDNDAAGRRACRKWKSVYPDAEVVLCDQGQDQNSLLQAGSLEEVKKQFEIDLPRYRLNGDLALADSANQYADIFYKFHQYAPGLFPFRRCTYFSSLKTPRGNDTQPYVSVARCLKGTVRVIYYILDRSNPNKPEFLYHLEIQPEVGRSIEATATGPDLSSNKKLTEWFLSAARRTWEGDPRACTALSLMITGNRSAPEVRQLTVTGYQPENGAYVFPCWAVDISGKHLVPDKRGFFQISYNQYFRPPTHNEGKNITPVGISKERLRELYSLIGQAWGNNGILALSWTIASWFVYQIKEAVNFFPFLSFFGDPASGKSALVVILNAIQGREGEGLPVTQLNSKKGLTRTIGQLSGLFTALLEDNERNDRAFDWSIILTAYNKGPLQVQAAFSNDLQTRESPFLGALLFCQNYEPFNSEAEKQRVISQHYKAEQLTDTTRAAYEKLTAIEKSELAGILRQVLINRKHFEEGWRQEYDKAIHDLSPMDERRILQNHALILAFHRLFCSCFGIPQDDAITNFFRETCHQKCSTSAVRQTTLADHFFELMDTIDEDKAPGAWYVEKKKSLIFINIPRVENLIRNKGINLQITEPLSKALQAHPAFVKNSIIYRFPDDPEIDVSGRPKQRRVWAFNLEWFRQNIAENIKW